MKTNLVKRNVLQVDTCDGCNEEVENSIHFFWKCSRAKETVVFVETGFSQCDGSAWFFLGDALVFNDGQKEFIGKY